MKLLIAEFAPAFAAWLLGVPVQSVRPLNAEFPAHPLRSDLLFEVLNRQGQKHLLHVEMQGRRSHQPMPYRELEYMSQTAVPQLPISSKISCQSVTQSRDVICHLMEKP